MRIESINLTLVDKEQPVSVRVEGSFIILTYPVNQLFQFAPVGESHDVQTFKDVYYNDQGRPVFTVTLDPPPPAKPLSRWTRFWRWLTYIQLSPIEQEEIQQWARHKK